jgi:hypothetical protein
MIEDLTIIIQGRCEDEPLKMWFENYSNHKVIISTWDDYIIPFEIPSNWKVIKADEVDFEFDGMGHMQNLEYQIVSTLNGLFLTETKYAIKVRGDEYWTGVDNIYHSLKSDEKLLCGSMFFRPLDSPYPFHIGDHVICGTVENMKIMFNKTKENLISNFRNNNTPESNLGMAYIQEKENYSIEKMFDICNTISWESYMKKWFDIFDINQLKPYIATQKDRGIRVHYRSNFTNTGCITKF